MPTLSSSPDATPLLLRVLLAVGIAVAVVPLWVAEILPLQDMAGHLATARVLHDLGAGSPLYEAVYAAGRQPLPNTLFFALTDWLSALMPLVDAARVVLTAASIALPLVALHVARTFGRSPWLALFSLFMVWSYPLGRGFLAFAISMPILLAVVAAAHRDAVEPTLRRGAVLAALVALSFFGHAQIYLNAMLFGGVVVVLSWGGVRAFARRLAPYAVGSLPFAVWFWRTFVERSAGKRISYAAAEEGFAARWTPLGELIPAARRFVIAVFPSNVDEVTLAAMGALLVALLALGALRRREPREPGLRRYTLHILTLVTLVCFFAVPAHMRGQASISFRFLPVAVLLASLCGAMPRRPAAVVALAVGMTAGASAWNAQVARENVRWQASRVGDLEGLLSLAEPGRRLAYLRMDVASYAQIEHRAMWYLDSYYMVYRHGLVQMNFHYTVPNHVYYAAGQEPPRTPRRSPDAFFRRGLDRLYDYLLVYSPRPPDLGPHQDRLRLLGRSARMYLYAIEPAPRPPEAS